MVETLRAAAHAPQYNCSVHKASQPWACGCQVITSTQVAGICRWLQKTSIPAANKQPSATPT